MAKTLLNAVNEVLKRVRVISGDAGALTTLTDTARQGPIDVAVQVINEGIDALYAASPEPMPQEQAEATITLVAGTRAYSLAPDLVQMRWPLVDKTNTQFIFDFAGGYNELLLLDPAQTATGLPLFSAIRPTDGKLHLDRAPTAADAGRIYTYQYDADQAMSAYTDTVPFGDAVFRAMVPAWVQLWKRENRNEFDQDLFRTNIGRAAQLLSEKQQRTDYSPR